MNEAFNAFFIIFAIMRIILLYILLVAFGCQQTPFLESENLKTSESEKGSEPRAMSNEQRFRKAQGSQHEAQRPSQVFSFSDSQILYYENQIRLADSLYKNYLPQYNFEEVKAAVMFFDSCEQRAMSNEPFLESENLKTSKSEKGQNPSQVFNFSDSQILFYAQKRITTTPSVSPNAMTS